MSDIERFEGLTREHLDALDDSDLVVAGSEVHKEAERWVAVDREMQREILRRAEMTNATLLIGADVDAEIEQKPGAYAWNVPALRERLLPVVGVAKVAEVITEVPHVCPPPEYKVNTVKLNALVKKLGKAGEGLLDNTFTRDPGRPKVVYSERAANVSPDGSYQGLS